MTPEYCRDCPFDGEILTKPVWRLMDPLRAADAVSEAKAHDVGLIFYRGEGEGDAVLKSAGFRRVETLLTFEQPLSGDTGKPPEGIRIAEPSDADRVAEIAASAFYSDRWHVDPNIPKDTADAYKSAWAKNDVLGRASPVFLAVTPNNAVSHTDIAGFNAVLVRDDTAIIDLIAIRPACQRQGHGLRLIQAAQSLPVSRLRVGTQASNTASIKLYTRMGLSEAHRQDTWHWTP